MAIELNYNDLNAAGEAAETASKSGSSSAISGLNDTLREVNELMDNMQQVQQKAVQMQGNQQQQGSQQGMGQGQGNPAQQPVDPAPSGQVMGKNDNSQSGNSQNILQEIEPQQVYSFLTDAVLKVEEDIGEDATMQDLEEYMVENQDDIKQLISTAQQMIVNGQAEQFLGGGDE